MIEFPYDDSYRPPAPGCQAAVLVARTGQSVGPLDAILDTGADGTLVPQQYLDIIGARRVMETGKTNTFPLPKRSPVTVRVSSSSPESSIL